MEYPSFDLDGQVALVTGASCGIGHDLALAHAGAQVAAGSVPGTSWTRSCRGSMRRAAVRTRSSSTCARSDATEEEWDELMGVNLKGLFFACQAAGRRMVEQRPGRIVNMSSQAGHVGIRRHAAYCASKDGVEQLTRVLALEWGPQGVTVNAVAPTFIYTPGTAERLDDPDFRADVVSRIPIGRVGTTSEVAAAVIFLASRAAALVNGAVLSADGGWTAQ